MSKSPADHAAATAESIVCDGLASTLDDVANRVITELLDAGYDLPMDEQDAIAYAAATAALR